jgi:LmbE family N-acetylglucosaminyl deacetylase
MKIAVVSAHRGDAAFGVGLSVGLWLQAGHSVELISCFTRSEFAPYSDADSVHANDRMSFVSAVRKREDESFVKLFPRAQFAGKLKLTELNLKDAPLRLHVGAEDVFGLAVNLAEKATVKIARAVVTSGAKALVAPLALARHIDHTTARDATVRGLAEDLPIALYEDLPYAAAMDDAEIQHTAHEIALGLRMSFTAMFAAGALDDVGVRTAVARKRKLAWCYDSQIDDAVTLQVAEFCTRYAGRERLWVNPAWAGSELAPSDSAARW